MRVGSKKSHGMKREIIPVILAKNAADFKKKLSIIKTLRPAPRMIQIDVVDGKFAPYKTWNNPKKMVKEIKAAPSPSPLPQGKRVRERAKIEVDLMVANPLKHARAWIKAGAERILFHVESLPMSSRAKRGDPVLQTRLLRRSTPRPRNDISKTIAYIKSHGVEVGLSLNPDTPIQALKLFLNPPHRSSPRRGEGEGQQIDCVLLLGVNPGKSGQQFQKKILAKIRALRKASPRLPIEVDGGVNLKNAKSIVRAGATRLATASALLGNDNPQRSYSAFLALRS